MEAMRLGPGSCYGGSVVYNTAGLTSPALYRGNIGETTTNPTYGGDGSDGAASERTGFRVLTRREPARPPWALREVTLALWANAGSIA
jgi:hypothetical protein